MLFQSKRAGIDKANNAPESFKVRVAVDEGGRGEEKEPGLADKPADNDEKDR